MSGRESLKGAPTEWKMCHVGTLQRRREGRVEQEWRVGRDEPMEAFGLQRGRAGLAMGLERAERVVFLSDGLPANRRIGLDPFPGQSRAARRRGMPGEGEGLQVIAELKGAAKEVRDRPEGWKRIRCFQPNADRIHSDQYRQDGLPIGSGKVEGASASSRLASASRAAACAGSGRMTGGCCGPG